MYKHDLNLYFFENIADIKNLFCLHCRACKTLPIKHWYKNFHLFIFQISCPPYSIYSKFDVLSRRLHQLMTSKQYSMYINYLDRLILFDFHHFWHATSIVDYCSPHQKLRHSGRTKTFQAQQKFSLKYPPLFGGLGGDKNNFVERKFFSDYESI